MFVRLGLAALTVSLGIGGLAEDVVHWSYPPRAWPRWEIQKARAYTYANGMNVGYPVVLSDVTKDATFRGKDGQTLSVSAASQGGVPCVRGDGWEVKTGSGKWVACDVFEGTEDTPPHLLGYPPVKGVPTFRDGLYSAEGETVAFIWCRSVKRPVLRVGESREEALSEDLAGFEQNVRMEPTGRADEWRSVAPLAFRHYRFVEPVEETWFVRDEMRRPLAGAYRSDDERLNRIWRASAETVRLCTRRFFVDAVKRDRMPWPGDDAIAFLADWATYRNAEAARFTIDALSCATFDGLADYSPWWVIVNGLYRRLYDDPDFIRRRWSVIRRRTDALSPSLRKDGAAEKAADRNFYIDWGDRGNPTAAYNVLMFAAFDTAAALAEELGKVEDAARWRTQAKKIADALASLAYDPKTGLFRCDIDDPSSKAYRQPNLLAVLFGLVKGAEAQRIGDALAKDDLPGVGTAWMAGLECIVLMMTGHKDVVPQRIDRIWGGMVDLGFNTIFEHWWPDAKGADVFRFYDRPFGLSLCHVASPAPAYLLPALQQERFTNPFDTRTVPVCICR